MAVYTLHFCGTDCWPTEGEVNNPGINPEFFCQESGYIPVRLYQRVKDNNFSFVIPGPGAPWAALYNDLWMPCSINDKASVDTMKGNSMIDLAGHAVACCVGTRSSGRKCSYEHQLPNADLCKKLNALLGSKFSSRKPVTGHCWWSDYSLEHLFQYLKHDNTDRKVTTVNMIGHSRGGVTAIMASHDIHRIFPDAKINIFAIDPVPGSGTLSTEMTTLSPGVNNYVGVYAIDERSTGFNGVVPRYRGGMGAMIDPLQRLVSKGAPRLDGVLNGRGGRYRLIYAPGRHGTVSGLATTDGKSENIRSVNEIISHVPALVSRLADSYFSKWGSIPSGQSNMYRELAGIRTQKRIDAIKDNMKLFRDMREFGYLPKSPTHYNERGVTSSSSRNASDWEYLEDSIGLEPTLVLRGRRLTNRPLPGKLKWEALEDLDVAEFA